MEEKMDHLEECRIIYENLRQAVRDPRTYDTHMRTFVEMLDRTARCDDVVDFSEVRADTYHTLDDSLFPGRSLLVRRNDLKEQIRQAFRPSNNLWFHLTFPFQRFNAWYSGEGGPFAGYGWVYTPRPRPQDEAFTKWWSEKPRHDRETCYACERAGDW